MSVYVRYAEDFTGVNPDNRVERELHSLNNRPIRVVVPKYGPFFNDPDTLVVFDNLTQQRLVHNVDYKSPMIVREATLRTGKEVCDAILILNENVSPQVHVTYQNIGGGYQNNVDNIVAMYESYINDNRSIDWLEGIYGKPTEFPPSLHAHWLSEIFGFEPLTVELERIAQAIQLGNTPAFEQLINAIGTKGATLAEMQAGKPLNKFVTLTGLLSVLDKYNFNSIRLSPAHSTLKNGQDLWVSVDASFVPEAAQYFWSIEHETTSPIDFVSQTGYVNLTNGVGSFMIQVAMDLVEEEDEYFRVALRRNSGTGQIVATTPRLKLQAHVIPPPDTILAALSAISPTDPSIQHTVKTTKITRAIKNATYS